MSERGEVRIGISACLLGERVRYDGAHKLDRYLRDCVGAFVTFVPVCPEVEAGFGVPRPTLRLQESADGTRLVIPSTGADVTVRMERIATARARQLETLDLDGYVLKKDSPSCGLERVKVYGRNGVAARRGRGVFARVLTERLPLLPVEEEGRLNDPRLREAFFECVFAHRRLQRLFAGRWTRGEVVAFHASEKLLLLAHEPEAYRELGRLVARVKDVPRAEFAARYARRFLHAMRRPATRGRHVNVLQHMAGYLTEHLDADGRAELAGVIADFRAGHVPLVVPVTLFAHLVRRHAIEWLAKQSYLHPHPKEMMLRNHV